MRKLHSTKACVVDAVGAMIEKASHGGEAHDALRPPPMVIEQMLKDMLIGSRPIYIRANEDSRCLVQSDRCLVRCRHVAVETRR